MGRHKVFVLDSVSEQVKLQFEMLFKVLDFDEESGDATVCDNQGTILAVSQSFSGKKEIVAEEWVGRTVYDFEKENIYNPSIAAKVLKEKKRMTLIHRNPLGEDVITTSVPIFKDGTMDIEYVVSFAAINIQKEYGLSEQFNELKSTLNKYRKKIDELENEKFQKKDLLAFGSKMSTVRETCTHIAKIDANVLISGESGVGKNVVAKYIHDYSNRSREVFIEINCGAIPENLIESELFGYEKGAFTGANEKGKKGLIEMARGGTLFLDEIGELPLNMQAKLLRVIQTKQVLKVGATKPIGIDFRLITATNRNLLEEIGEKRFREDLFYRLNVIPIYVHPLRERTEDVEYMARYFLDMYNKKYGEQKTFSTGTIDSFLGYDWPGNVRELENLVERLVVTTKEKEVNFYHLAKSQDKREAEWDEPLQELTLKEVMDNYESQIIKKLYSKYKSSVKVAQVLGIGQTTASNKIRKYIK